MKISGLEFTEHQVLDTLTTLVFVFFALVVPGYIQMQTGISAIRTSFLVVVAYLAGHILLEHISEFH